jgi:Flp pilus assembly protein CpaB
VLALAAVLLLHGYLSRDALARPIGPNIGVVVAAETLDRGTTVQPSALRMARLPRQYAPPGAITDMSKAAGRVLLAGLLPGEVVTETRLARVRAGPVASLVPRGLRAFAVPTSLAPGAVVPGDRVDVLATFGSGQPHTEMVANGAEVLLVLSSRRSHGEGGGIGGGGLDAEAVGVSAPTTLILLVSSGQEESLAYARAFGSVEVAIVPSE